MCVCDFGYRKCMQLINIICEFGYSCMQFAGCRDVAARKDVGGYWKNAMDRQAMPEAIQGRIDHPQTAGKGVHFVKDFNISPVINILYRNSSAAHPEAEKSPVSKAKP